MGEGDERWNDDYIELNGTRLWDGITCSQNSESYPNNVWNCQSVGMEFDGVDIDTFEIPWVSGVLEAGDTSAHLDIWSDAAPPYNVGDNWNLVYVILSVRSETYVGGTTHYLIRSI